jgi:hypothetical protein
MSIQKRKKMRRRLTRRRGEYKTNPKEERIRR